MMNRDGRRWRLRGIGALLAGVALVAVAGLSGGASSAAQAEPVAATSGTTFTVGLLNNVDSFNPFLGIEAESYEMWALMYDYMIRYSDKDMSPEPGLATSWDTTNHGLT